MNKTSAILTLAALAAATAVSAADWTELRGLRSRVVAPKTVTVSAPEQWEALWLEHSRGAKPAPELKAGEAVLAVFQGARLSAEGAATSPFLIRKVPAAQVATAPQASLALSALAAEAASERLRDAVAAHPAPRSFDGALARGGDAAPSFQAAAAPAAAEASFVKAQLPPPPGEGASSKPLPPPPGQGGENKPLPPPPGGGGDNKPLPPPPGGGSDPLPRPGRDGQLSGSDDRLRNATPAYSTNGMTYLGYWELDSSGWQTATGRLATRPQDGGSYILNLDSSYVERTRDFYHDGASYYYVDRSKSTATRSKRITIDFVNRAQKPLLPWETEEFIFAFTGAARGNGVVELKSASGAYRYTYGVFFDPADKLTAQIEMQGHEKLLTQPDGDGISAAIASDGRGGLKLVVTDRWASHYGGETLQIRLKVRKDDGSRWKRNPVVLDATKSSPLSTTVPSASGAATWEWSLGLQGSGKFEVDEWQFKREGSRLSAPVWVHKGKGNTVTH